MFQSCVLCVIVKDSEQFVWNWCGTGGLALLRFVLGAAAQVLVRKK